MKRPKTQSDFKETQNENRKVKIDFEETRNNNKKEKKNNFSEKKHLQETQDDHKEMQNKQTIKQKQRQNQY